MTQPHEEIVWVCDNEKCDHARKNSSLKEFSHLIETRKGIREICSGTLRPTIPLSLLEKMIEERIEKAKGIRESDYERGHEAGYIAGMNGILEQVRKIAGKG